MRIVSNIVDDAPIVSSQGFAHSELGSGKRNGYAVVFLFVSIGTLGAGKSALVLASSSFGTGFIKLLTKAAIFAVRCKEEMYARQFLLGRSTRED